MEYLCFERVDQRQWNSVKYKNLSILSYPALTSGRPDGSLGTGDGAGLSCGFARESLNEISPEDHQRYSVFPQTRKNDNREGSVGSVQRIHEACSTGSACSRRSPSTSVVFSRITRVFRTRTDTWARCVYRRSSTHVVRDRSSTSTYAPLSSSSTSRSSRFGSSRAQFY